jgi:hypothetical protein
MSWNPFFDYTDCDADATYGSMINSWIGPEARARLHAEAVAELINTLRNAQPSDFKQICQQYAREKAEMTFAYIVHGSLCPLRVYLLWPLPVPVVSDALSEVVELEKVRQQALGAAQAAYLEVFWPYDPRLADLKARTMREEIISPESVQPEVKMGGGSGSV